MSSAEQLLQLICSWMQQQERCEEQLRMLDRKLEDHRRSRLHRGVRVLKSTLEGIGLMVVLLLTVVTLGAFSPVLNVTAEMCTKKKKPKPAELFLKDRQNVEKRSTDITAEIHRLLEELKTDATEDGSCSEPDQVDQYVLTQVLTALARRSGLKGRVRISFSSREPQIFMETTELIGGPAVMMAVAGILAFFTFQVSGQKLKPLFDEGLQQLIKQMSPTGVNAEVDGVTGLAMNLQQATDTWTGMIQRNQVTKVRQSLRDTADMMQRIIETLRQQLDNIKRTFDEAARQHEEQPKKLNKNKEEKTGNPKVVFTVIVRAKRSVNVSQKVGAGDQTEGRQHEQSSRTNRNRGRNEDTEQTGGHPGGTGGERQGGDAGGQRSNTEDEDDTDEEDSDQSSDSIRQLSNSEDEDGEKIHLETVSELSVSPCNMGLLNARSINNKQSRIRNLIDDFRLKVLMLTETWVNSENGDQRLAEINPEELKFYQQPRVDKEGKPRRGGGVAILHSKELKGESVRFEDTSFESFEYVAADLHPQGWTEPIRTITIYRPPGYNVQNFLNEFQNLVKNIKNKFILITGDFNIWVNDKKYKPAKDFEKVLEKNDLRQHEKNKTHNRGKTLDLVITRNVDISNLTETETTISDHSAVTFEVCPTSENTF